MAVLGPVEGFVSENAHRGLARHEEIDKFNAPQTNEGVEAEHDQDKDEGDAGRR